MGRKNISKILDKGQWLNAGNTLSAFYDEMIRFGNYIDELNGQLRNANDQLNGQTEELTQLRATTNDQTEELDQLRAKPNDQNQELVKLRAEKKEVWSKIYGQNDNMKQLKKEIEGLRLRLTKINELSAS